jgi:tRNA-intron endonuclease, archaea type
MTISENESAGFPPEDQNRDRSRGNLEMRPEQNRDDDLQQSTLMGAFFSKKLDHVVLASESDASALESKGFGIKEGQDFYLNDYEVLYLVYNNKLALKRMAWKSKKSSGKLQDVKFTDYVSFSLERDENAWTRFLIFRDLRSRGYVVREGFGFPIDFRVYDRGDYGNKAAKYIVFGLNEGKTMTLAELKKHVEEMSTMGKEAVIAVVERRGEVIYYKVAKWRPIKPL